MYGCLSVSIDLCAAFFRKKVTKKKIAGFVVSRYIPVVSKNHPALWAGRWNSWCIGQIVNGR